MAEYTWKQWEQTQDNDNLINNAACLRWQAGIELAGGSWSGSFEDGKDSITIDEFNALESQINSKVSSYTPKNYDPSSTVQIVPGVDGWNKVEDGILKAICTPDGVNRNWFRDTRSFVTGFGTTQTTVWNLTEEDGFGVRTQICDTSQRSLFIMGALANDDAWANKDIVASMDAKFDGIEQSKNEWLCHIAVMGTNSSTGSWANKYRATTTNSQALLTSTAFFTTNINEFKNDEWGRLTIKFTMLPLSELSDQSTTEYATLRYAIQIYSLANDTGYSWSIRKPKIEVSDEATDWVDAPEDYGYPSNTTLSATPQSVEDSDEVAAPEAEEIE